MNTTDLIAHEWGTFTTVSRGNGIIMPWQSYEGAADLPDFVHTMAPIHRIDKTYSMAMVRMETPVVYFYTQTPQTVAVRAKMPAGIMTEWYPQAMNHLSFLDWPQVQLLPDEQVTVPTGEGDDHYTASRETDAVPVRVQIGDKTEHEKLLFYRGVGMFQVPISVKLEDDKIRVEPKDNAQYDQVIVFDNRDGKPRFSVLEPGKHPAEVRRDSLANRGTPESELFSILTANGLYVKEAKAMLKTWRDSWYEPGLRVFYVLPQQQMEEVLELTIIPQPKELKRVIVGRYDVLTPEQVSELKESVLGAKEINDELVKEAREEFGRFVEPLSRLVMNEFKSDSPEYKKAGQFYDQVFGQQQKLIFGQFAQPT
ncbi:MAG: hypothetical protein AAF492_27625, partial [Verrucomicrobiota bacterium]